MAVVISDENIQKFKESNNDIHSTLLKWDTPCDSIKSFLEGDVGSVFNENFGVGRTAHKKITSLVEILQEMEKSINTLISDTNTFLDEHAQSNQTTF